MSERLVEACPDMREMARSIAREILLRHTGHDTEPDTVYWHRFHRAVNSPRSFNGWQHRDAPYQSMTLPQLVMHRFNPHDQDNADTLQMLSGFYSAGADATAFDEHNEIRMLPAQVISDFWAADFKSRYQEKLNAFWRDFADDFRTLAKANFIASAFEDLQAGWLSEEDLRTVLRAANVEPSVVPSLQTLQASAPASVEAKVWTFDVIGYEASDVLRIVTSGGRQILYTPGEVQAFHGFATSEELHWWLLSQNNRTERRARFMGHFPLSAHGEVDENVGLYHGLDVLYTTWGSAHPGVINQHSQPVSGDPFTHLRDAIRARMFADADLALHSNSDLRKQMWIGYLRAFSQLSGALAAIDWPVALAAVGAGIADMGLNIDQALNGASTAQRKAGVIGAVTASIDVLFNSTFLVGGEAVPEGEMLQPEEGGPAIDVDESVDASVETPGFEPDSVYPFERNDTLASFETNMLLDAFEPVREEGRMKGIYLTDQGETFIEIDGFAYAVRYINELKSWAIIDPANPYSFYRSMPVRLNSAGVWEPINRLNLLGGGKVLGKMGSAHGDRVYPQTATLPSPYEVPAALKPEVMDGAQNGGRFVSDRYHSQDFDKPDPYDDFKRIRRNLRDDANAFFNTLELPKRPEIPELPANAPLKSFLKTVFKRSAGLVIGESHAAIGSKQFLIEQMPLLTKLKVKTLYMEHVLTDFHQVDLDAFSRTGTMSPQLEDYIKTLDKGHRTDPTGKYTFMAVFKAARENRVRIRAIDCMASYRVDGMDGAEQALRQKMMNYYAKGVIEADQAARSGGNWVALVGNSHANTYQGVPGVAELEGVIGLRIEDVRVSQSAGITPDPGVEMTDTMGRPAGRVQSDLRLQVLVVAPRTELNLENKLLRPGMFTLDESDGQLTLVHRSNEGVAVRTEIKREGKRVYIDRPKWRRVSGRRFETLADLTTALELMGMTLVR
ncbi:membrane-targeted effector domain-containing toxin [Pseudomonas petrae]|uniref:Membrane-targeted effector domain-containing toxin n=1 Tax=Pseudomonas petrae TaxID=2912190 RepID=A0ABS9I3L8_9PSED|nr:membrane-targeted effector domain-containing toxin [Pseudomonas petrae]MCF7541976.1 membrane-targeted effector domain-containing toxin [Pseudomonas petrae]